jgi:hypothetical protein
VNTQHTQRNSNIAGIIGALWAVTGFSLLLLFPIIRLGAISLDSLNHDLQWFHWISLLFSIVFMAYSEGYKGFQLKFSPRFSARCFHLRQQPTMLHVILAPLFCMGFFHTTRSRKITTFALTFMILCVIQLAGLLPQPWRGVLDFGVVTGLIWGLASLYYFLIKAFSSIPFDHCPELPGSDK